MKNPEKAVRDAARTLHDALVDAKKAGLAVAWPHNADGLLSIAVSETSKATPEPTPPPTAKAKSTSATL